MECMPELPSRKRMRKQHQVCDCLNTEAEKVLLLKPQIAVTVGALSMNSLGEPQRHKSELTNDRLLKVFNAGKVRLSTLQVKLRKA